jgi:hypothetical protein
MLQVYNVARYFYSRGFAPDPTKGLRPLDPPWMVLSHY